jgi:hypothetical protein
MPVAKLLDGDHPVPLPPLAMHEYVTGFGVDHTLVRVGVRSVDSAMRPIINREDVVR